MKRPWLWVIGGKWDKLAALTRLFTAMAVIMLAVAYFQAQGNYISGQVEITRLQERQRTNTNRITQLEMALRDAGQPIPSPPTTTTQPPASTASTHSPRSQPTDSSSTTRPSPTPHPSPTPTTTTTTTTVCPTPTIPVNGSCVNPEAP